MDGESGGMMNMVLLGAVGVGAFLFFRNKVGGGDTTACNLPAPESDIAETMRRKKAQGNTAVEWTREYTAKRLNAVRAAFCADLSAIATTTGAQQQAWQMALFQHRQEYFALTGKTLKGPNNE